VKPVVAVLLGTLVLGEPLGWRTIVGGGIILGAVALIVRAPKPLPTNTVEPRPAALAARGR
jgi:drug/metabolite transporter (DMT)-like permease